MITPTLRQRVIDRVTADLATANNHFGIALQMPKIVYEKRGTTAGTACPGTWTIDLNAVLFTENVEAFLSRTVPHELAHLIHSKIEPSAHYGQKREIHGHGWQRVMAVLGADSSRCHSYDTTNSRQQKTVTRFHHECTVCGQTVEVGAKHHRSIQQGISNIYHTTCGRQSRFKPSTVVTVKSNIPGVAPRPTLVPKAPSAGSKIERCYVVYKNHPNLSRAHMIRLFVDQCDCTTAGASTYYQTCKKMAENGV